METTLRSRRQDIKATEIQQTRSTLENVVTENIALGERMQKRIRDGEKLSPPKVVQFSAPRNQKVYAARQGFVSSATIAYNEHHDLVWRPDDVWLAILTQFSLYVLKNAEKLRDKLVDFEGKRQLTVQSFGTLLTTDFGELAKRMVDEQIVKNIKDPSIAHWLLPGFSTTTENDRIVASVCTMSALQAFFDYKFSLLCGLPSITLLGTREDWMLLREKVDRLLEMDAGDGLMKKWHPMLTSVLDEFVRTKSGVDNMEFWDRICHYSGGGSGPTFLSGWITAFAVFDNKGKWQGDRMGFTEDSCDEKTEKFSRNTVELKWPVVDTADLPSGVVSVPVVVDDNGKEYNTHMFAGHFAFDGEGTKVQPRSDWCIAIDPSVT